MIPNSSTRRAPLLMQDEKAEIVDGQEYAFSSNWIHSLESEEHWRLYWHQQELMQNRVVAGQHVLEIGVGSGFSANYFRSKGVEVTTLDIDADKSPDIVGNIVTYDFRETYDAILAFEVFEHIPFADFAKLLPSLRRACRNGLYLSVPVNRKTVFRLTWKLPRMKPRNLQWNVARGRLSTHHHHWEVSHNGIELETLRKLFEESGLMVHRQKIVFHRLFLALDCADPA